VDQHVLFDRDDPAPSWWANAIQRFLSIGAPQLQIQLDSPATSLTVPAGAGELAAVIAIDGKWRWNEAPLTVAHPGGAAGGYNVWVTASNNNVVDVPDPGTDLTNYAFGLAIRANASGAPATDLSRLVGSVQWDGAAMSELRQTVGRVNSFESLWLPDGTVAAFDEGLLAARPVATAVDPGSFYYSTDTSTLARSTGVAWQTVFRAQTDWAETDYDFTYMRDRAGVVRLRGTAALDDAINLGTALPSGFRPGVAQTFVVPVLSGNGGGVDPSYFHVTVGTNGVITTFDDETIVTIDLSPVQFFADGG
jgi:hypothetical protein